MESTDFKSTFTGSEGACIIRLRDICPICLDFIDESVDTLHISSCNHLYHKRCILSWFLYRGKYICPLCKCTDFIIPLDNLLEIENMENVDISEKKQRLRALLRRYYDQSINSSESDSDDSIRELRIQRRVAQRTGLKFWQFCLIYLGIIGMFIGVAFLIMEGHMLILKNQSKRPRFPIPTMNTGNISGIGNNNFN